MSFPTGPGQNRRMSTTKQWYSTPHDHDVDVCPYFCRAGEKITVTPSSKELLFYPPEVEATITGGEFLHT